MSNPFTIIKEAFEDAGHEVRSYSGRAMYGKECLGVTCSNPIRAVLETVAYLVENQGDSEEVTEAIDALARDPRTDSMGMAAIVYFPNIAWEEEDEEDEAGFELSAEDKAWLDANEFRFEATDPDDDAPCKFAVWDEGEEGGGDIVGSGDTVEEAMRDARETVRAWNQSSKSEAVR